MLLKSNANNLPEKEKVFMYFQFYTIGISNQFLKELAYFLKRKCYIISTWIFLAQNFIHERKLSHLVKICEKFLIRNDRLSYYLSLKCIFACDFSSNVTDFSESFGKHI